MKNTLLGMVAALTFVATSSLADENAVAPQELVQEFTQMCLEWANDDGVEAKDLKKYVLDCVNDELTSSNYQTVSSVEF
ncbi:hypothetical protein [Pseudoalteromonas sp. S16_S37]|uniref:hypothetical protein n=1 Tax=Pseudoalteromonas sp. S16_S37 TaxID=2720228 RepID=UPI001681BC39|nr:hypothetical protein [Pseudoalteromonas sp. S16_S37]MBD1582443.1 hypothetical protein [Pseudoalteromonas sp. S16_S37]